jgi:cytochrome c oxidase cbb3-type subunit 1
MNASPASEPRPGGPSTLTAPDAIDFSCRLPLLVLFLSSAIWLCIGLLCQLLGSIKFHSPNFLASPAWLTYGRLQPAANNAVLYGGVMQGMLGVALWLLARLGAARGQRITLTFGASFWNLGVTIGFIGILAGDSTGFATLEFPRYSVLFLFLGYVLLSVCGAILFHRRQRQVTFPSQWFIFAALFWFPWIFTTAELLLVAAPVRGVDQAVLAWWYAENLLIVWLGLVGLATLFYFVARLLERELHSHYLALATFWMLLLFGGWGGIPITAPVPAWMPATSVVATVLMLIPLLAVALNVHRTMAGRFAEFKTNVPLRFIMFGAAAFLAAGVMKILGALADTQQQLALTWFTSARNQLYIYGFFGMAMFGAVYYIVPQLVGAPFASRKAVQVHFWLAAAGVILLIVPLAAAGIIEASGLQNPKLSFMDVFHSTLMPLRVSTVGYLLLFAASAFFLINLLRLVAQFYRAQAAAALAVATEDLFKPAGAKA